MRNRAKCKLCEDVIESYTILDEVECYCGEICISGGNQQLNCMAKNWCNFLRVDDMDNIIIPTVKDVEDGMMTHIVNAPSCHELIERLESYVKAIEDLPTHAKTAFITHTDLHAVTSAILNIIKSLSS